MRAVLLVGLVFGFGLGCGKKDASTKSDTSSVASVGGIPADWTHKELFAHMQKAGAKLRMETTVRGTIKGPAVFFMPTGAKKMTDQEAMDAMDAGNPDLIYCRLYPTAQVARDDVGTLGDKAFANGRFAFQGQPTALANLKTFLP